jgi:DNA-directed RNA polymerase subunit RPC12/RpoP
MATQPPSFMAGVKCPNCAGRLEAKPRAGVLASSISREWHVYAVAGVCVALGLLWGPAWLAAMCTVAFAMVRRPLWQPLAYCVECKREYTQSALYGVR